MNIYQRSEPQGQTAFPIARPGYPLIGAAAFTTAVFALLHLTVPALLGLSVTFFICWFFRDPDRATPLDENAVVSPADGRVVYCDRVNSSPFMEGPLRKISIFMSVFNVHVNRIPHEGVVKDIIYHPGKFFSANLDKASKDNEHNAVIVETAKGRRLCFVQIAGLVARRIICHLEKGDEVIRGRRFGMICFGSRLDVYLPPEATVDVSMGDKVTAGTTVLGRITT